MLAEQNLRARLLQHAPLVAQWVTQKTLSEFFAYAEKLAMDWQLPLQFLSWLHTHCREQLNEAMIKELLVATAVRWVMQGLEHIRAKGILVVSSYSTIAVVLWKSTEVDTTHKINFMRLAELPNTNSYQFMF